MFRFAIILHVFLSLFGRNGAVFGKSLEENFQRFPLVYMRPYRNVDVQDEIDQMEVSHRSHRQTRQITTAGGICRIVSQRGSYGEYIELHNEWNLHYGFPIWIGTPPQSFCMSLDTGSSDIYVPSINGQDLPLRRSINKFNPVASSTLEKPSGLSTFSLSYKTGGVTGNRRMDTLYLGDMVIKKQIFGEATSELVDSFDYPFDGTFGFGFSYVSATDNNSTPLDNLKNQGQISKRQFCVKLNPMNTQPGGELFIGGCYVAAQYWKSLSVPNFWQIVMTKYSVTANGISQIDLCMGGCQALLDTGMALIGGPQNKLDAIAQKIGATFDESNQNYMIKCALGPTLPNMEFHFDEIRIALTPNDYLTAYGEPGMCNIGLTRMETPYYSAEFLLGDPFLRMATIIYDKDNSRIGFAEIR